MMARQKQLTLQGDKAVEPQAQIGAVAAPLSPMEMLASALERGQSPELIEKLMDLAERWDKNHARKAFEKAMAAAKAEIKPVQKTKRVHYKSKDKDKPDTDYVHETMADLARSVDEVLGKHGLSYRYQSRQDNGNITVTCIVTHEDGHFTETPLTAGRDEGAGKNNLQALGSALTYLQRYTLKIALGLAAYEDDDGKKGGTDGTITAKQFNEIDLLVDRAGANLNAFLALYKISELEDLPASKFEDAKAKLERKLKMKQAQEAAEIVQEAQNDS